MQLEQTIQQNAMLTGQSAATAEHFAAQAERLQKAVAFFQLENSPPDNNGKDDKRDVS
jgi:methyl-accepting chemotaxis protein